MSSLPQSIGKYHVKRLLGEGAMGLVYEGLDEAIDRRVAIKTLHPHLLSNKNGIEFLERFKREAKSAARCTHPNVVTVLEYGEDEGIPFIAMEYIDGYSLHDIIMAKKRVSLKNTLSILSQVLKAIHAAHKLGVVHRDIKTANIILSKKNNEVKLADFGIARFADNSSMTMTGAVVGTPRYMAPEQMFGLKVDERADLFSVAMVFVELLSKIPATNAYPTSRLNPIEGLPPNNQVNYAIPYPEALIPVLQKGLASKASDRYQSAREFATAIKQAVVRLKQTAPANAAQVQVAPTLVNGIQPRELESLTGLLTHYLGPVSRNMVRDASAEQQSLDDMVNSLSAEISDSAQRTEFLRKWKEQQDMQSLSNGGELTTHDMSSLSTRGSRINVDDNTIQKIGQDYINYIGPFAMRMVDYYCQNSSDKEEFIQNLANEIPDQGLRDEFSKKWSLA